MLIYHGSYCTVETPKIIKGRYTKDFGEGFYCTIIKDQAARWAMKYSEAQIVNIYDYDEMKATECGLSILKFDSMTEEWLDFIVSCRNGKKFDYDIITGAMADDQVFNYITDFLNGTITREAFWVLAKFKHPTHQIVFTSAKALNCIRFVKSEVVHDDRT